jgi:hypothetical protein
MFESLQLSANGKLSRLNRDALLYQLLQRQFELGF